MTSLTKNVVRKVETVMIRDAGRLRAAVVTLYPSGVIGIRPEKTRREELLPLAAVWDVAVKKRVATERKDKAAAKAAKKKARAK